MVTVFLVDDCKLITNMYSEYLVSQGYSVEYVNSPFGAIAKIAHNNPNVILMDLNLPGLSGKGILELLKGTRTSPIILISGDTQETEMKILIAMGLADGYFVKGQPLEVLDSKIKELL